jgi:putative PIG3 family NAD(P)H quinone oxidoreductase
MTDHQVLIQVKAFGINRADLLQRAGKYPPPKGESLILGLEVAGEIIACGSQVSQWQIGQRVCALVAGGGYATEVAVNAEHVIALPENLSFVDGAGLVEVFLTAFQALHQVAAVQAGDNALIHAGASGVGQAAIQLCRYAGVNVATTASSDEKLSICAELGASVCVNYKQQDYVAELKSAWPQGVNFILDMIGGDYLNKNLKVLAMDGTVVYLAMMAGRYADKLDMAFLLGKRAQLKGSTLRNRSDEYKADLIRNFSQQCLAGFNNGQLKVTIDSVFSVDDIELAHQRMEKNDTAGKLIIEW